MADFFKRPKPLVLISMDGVGIAPQSPGNAVMLADTKNLDKYWPLYPHTTLEASQLNVGLPSGTDGNSEVGHMAMGAGRVIFQNLPRIDNSIAMGDFFRNPTIIEAFDHAKTNGGNVHFMGLIGSGSVHASVPHLKALLKFALEQKVDGDRVYLHAFTDGRDSAPTESLELLDDIESFMHQKRVGKLASVMGRAFAMDRNRNWKRTKIAYDALVEGIGTKTKNWKKSIQESHKKEVLDEYIDPLLIEIDGKDIVSIKANDTVIFFNFRPDRAVQLTMAFEDKNFRGFDRPLIKNLYFAGMNDYENGFPTHQMFPPEKVLTPLGRALSDAGLKQLRIAESEKFPHVTYFFNGQNKEIMPGETWMEIPSPKDVATYDEEPEMSQKWVAKTVVEKIEEEKFDFILVNFAGPDMVAHTGNIPATVIAMNACDEAIGMIVDATLKKDGAIIITADHGNAEEMLDLRTGKMDTKHSTNPVPAIIIKKGLGPKEIPVGGLADIAPTILRLLGIPQPAEMTGRDLLS